MVRFSRTDSRLANNGLPLKLQKLRCRVNYNALQFAPSIEALGKKMISALRKTGSFIVLHLRYEMDMLAFSGCTHGCSDEETAELTRMRFHSILNFITVCTYFSQTLINLYCYLLFGHQVCVPLVERKRNRF